MAALSVEEMEYMLANLSVYASVVTKVDSMEA
jgi:hypothetical protein